MQESASETCGQRFDCVWGPVRRPRVRQRKSSDAGAGSVYEGESTARMLTMRSPASESAVGKAPSEFPSQIRDSEHVSLSFHVELSGQCQELSFRSENHSRESPVDLEYD